MKYCRCVYSARKLWQLAGLGLLLAVLPLQGCSGRPMAPVSGKVTYKGEPVKGGELVFSPIPPAGEMSGGKGAVGEIKPDGTYVLGTYRGTDGAVVGKHKVSFTPPPVDYTPPPSGSPKEGDPKARSPYAGLVPKQNEVEVKPGDNSIDIELAPLPPRG